MGVASREGQALNIMRPPAEHSDSVLERFKNIFSCDHGRSQRIQAAWVELPTSTIFTMPNFDRFPNLFEPEEVRQDAAPLQGPGGAQAG